MRYAALLAALLLATPAASRAGVLRGQSAIVDEGSFALSKDGARVGREDFVLRRIRGAGGDLFQASGTSALGDRRLAPAMEGDSAGVPFRYQLEIKSGGQLEEQLRAQFSRGRATVHVRGAGGEATREFVVGNGALLLEDEVFHLYYFVARAAGRGTLFVIVPRRNTQLSVRVEPRAQERLSIGGTLLSARHLIVTDGGGSQRHVWVDDRGRVLKAVDDHGLTAVREDPPR